MTYLRSTLPIARKAKPHQMHTNDSSANAVTRALKPADSGRLHAITLGFVTRPWKLA